jgi:hypothetical protein
LIKHKFILEKTIPIPTVFLPLRYIFILKKFSSRLIQ